VARRYRGRGEPLEDLEQVARLALVKAVDRYDPARGSFTGYAGVTMTGEIRRHFRDHTWGVHVPRRYRDQVAALSVARSTLAMSLNRHPTDDELAERLGVSTEELRNIMVGAAGYQSASLNAPVPHVDTELEAFVGEQDAALDGVADRVALDRLLLRLPDRERQLLNLRFYGNKTQVEIAETLGISQMHVSRLLSRTLSWLREALLTDAPSLWPGIGQAQDPTQLRTRVTTGPVGPVLSVVGEIDRDCAEELLRAIEQVVCIRSRAMEIDLVLVPLVDAAGARALGAGVSAADRAGVRAAIVRPQPAVRRVLAVAGVIGD
jgi:RNA polymerase sigma-B factor